MACWRSSAYMMLVHRPSMLSLHCLHLLLWSVKSEPGPATRWLQQRTNTNTESGKALSYVGPDSANRPVGARIGGADWSAGGRRPVSDPPRDLPAMAERIVEPAQAP